MLGASLDARVFASDSSALARDCRRDIKAASARLLKLGRKVQIFPHSPQAIAFMLCCLALRILQCMHIKISWDLYPAKGLQAPRDRVLIGISSAEGPPQQSFRCPRI